MSIYRGPERRTSPNGQIVDVLALMQCPSGYHLEGTHHLHSYVGPGHIFATKSDKGFPWDVRLFDANMIYCFATELDWTSPKDYKGALHPTAMPFMYRYAYDGDIVKATDSTTAVFQGCKQVRTFSLGGVQHTFHGPIKRDLAGDLGLVDTYDILYQWSGQPDGTFKVMETFTYAPGYGQVGWQTQNFNYATQQYDLPHAVSTFNLVCPGSVVPVHPCF